MLNNLTNKLLILNHFDIISIQQFNNLINLSIRVIRMLILPNLINFILNQLKEVKIFFIYLFFYLVLCFYQLIS